MDFQAMILRWAKISFLLTVALFLYWFVAWPYSMSWWLFPLVGSSLGIAALRQREGNPVRAGLSMLASVAMLTLYLLILVVNELAFSTTGPDLWGLLVGGLVIAFAVRPFIKAMLVVPGIDSTYVFRSLMTCAAVTVLLYSLAYIFWVLASPFQEMFIVNIVLAVAIVFAMAIPTLAGSLLRTRRPELAVRLISTSLWTMILIGIGTACYHLIYQVSFPVGSLFVYLPIWGAFLGGLFVYILSCRRLPKLTGTAAPSA